MHRILRDEDDPIRYNYDLRSAQARRISSQSLGQTKPALVARCQVIQLHVEQGSQSCMEYVTQA